MAKGIIEKIAVNPCTVSIGTGVYADGVETMKDYSALGFRIDGVRDGFNPDGSVRRISTIFIAPSIEVAPKVPCKVTYGGETMQVAGVDTYRNMKSVLLGYRLEVAQ